MGPYVAFLRGMNLGGRRITNDGLRAEFERLGFEGVATFRASGNVIFASSQGLGGDGDHSSSTDPRGAEGGLGRRIEAGLATGLGYEVPVYLRAAAQVAAIAAQQPFGPEAVGAAGGKLQVLILSQEPSTAARRQALALSSDEDRLAIAGRELYWLPHGRMSDSELDLKAIAAALGPGTMRTMRTIEQIAAKHCA